MAATARWLAGGKRLHFQHGPIDLVIEAFGAEEGVGLAYRRAWARFQNLLLELVEELPRLRSLCRKEGLGLKGRVARRMEQASQPYAGFGVTPMVAVAGAVADDILDVMRKASKLDRAYVNNGGDIAVHLGNHGCFEIAMVGRPAAPVQFGSLSLRAGDPTGIATSGRHGRSFSLGIADSVTVLAESAATADAAATLIANAVDLPESPKVTRIAASSLDPDSDLGDREVTIDVQPLNDGEIRRALSAGVTFARDVIDRRLITAAALSLGDRQEMVGDWPSLPSRNDVSTKLPALPPRQAKARPL